MRMPWDRTVRANSALAMVARRSCPSFKLCDRQAGEASTVTPTGSLAVVEHNYRELWVVIV